MMLGFKIVMWCKKLSKRWLRTGLLMWLGIEGSKVPSPSSGFLLVATVLGSEQSCILCVSYVLNANDGGHYSELSF